MADRSVVIRLGLNVSGLVAGARTASKALGDVGGKGLDWVGKHEQSLNHVTTGLGVMGLAAVAGAGLAVRAFANFDEAMSHVAATGDDARGSLDALRQAALDAGAETAYSATEAAGAIEELAKAGVSAEDILAGGLDGALDLAAAGGIEVAQAAEIAASAMTQFGLSGDDVVHVADLLAAGAGKAQGGVHELGMALAQAGLVADQTGLSIEETTGGLAAFASAGLLGSDAGTSMKTMLQRLTPTSKEAADEMDRLGISAYDSQGNFIGLAEFAGNLQAALRDLTPEQRNAAMATIFGSDAVRAASILYEQGEGGIRNWIAAVDDQGYAAETAATRMDNLKGDVEQFLGALETALIGAGEGADGPLRKLVQGATDAVGAFNDLPPGVQSATLAIVGGGGLVALGVAGLGKLVVGISNTRDAMNDLGLSGGKAGRALRFAGVVGAVGAATFAVWELNKALNQTDISSQAAYEGVLALSRGESSAAIDDLISAQVRLRDAAEPIADPSLWGRIKQGVDSIAGPGALDDMMELSGASEEFTTGLQMIDAELAKLASGGDLEGATAAFDELANRLGYQGDQVDRLREKLPAYQEALRGTSEDQALAEHSAAAAGAAVGAMGGEFAGGTAAIDAQAEALAKWLDQIRTATDPVYALNSAVVGVSDAQTAYNDAVTEFGPNSAEAQQAALDLMGAVGELEAAALNGDLSFDQFAAKLQQWVDQGAITQDQADAISDRVGILTGVAEDYAGTYQADVIERGAIESKRKTEAALGKVDEFGRRNVIAHLRAQAETSRAEGALNYVARDRIAQVRARFTGMSGGGAAGLDAMASGGTARYSGFHRVGEQGPELRFLNKGDYIATAAETDRILRGLSASSEGTAMRSLSALGIADIRWVDSLNQVIRDGAESVEDSLDGLDASIDRAAAAYDRMARAVPAPLGLAKPNRPDGKQPLNLTQLFARDLLAAVKAGKRIGEDFSWSGMSDRWTDEIRSVLWELFYAGDRNYTGTKPIADWVADWLGSASKSAPTASKSITTAMQQAPLVAMATGGGGNVTLNLEFSGPVGNKQVLLNWLAEGVDTLRRQGRV